MSQSDAAFYEFGDFKLDTSERLLVKNGEAVTITPKVYETLLVLVRNAGQIVEKEDLIREIWQDRFVEESNLTFNIRMLRKALGDVASSPEFIETLPRRGYRFLAPVRVVKQPEAEEAISIDPSHSRLSTRSWLAFALGAVLVVMMGGAWYLTANSGASRAAFSPVISEKLSSNGRVFNAAISPDGRFVAYSNAGGSQQGLWIRQLETGNNVEIARATEGIVYYGLTFSPGGDHLYFSRSATPGGPNAIYKMSTLGGGATKLADAVKGAISVSPDGRSIAFVRCLSEKRNCELLLADSLDGSNERVLSSQPDPLIIRALDFSPDGRSIVFASGHSENQANEFSILQVDLETGDHHAFSSERFFDIKGLSWLSDGTGIVVAASRIPNRNFRLWRVEPGTKLAEPLTSESESFASVSFSDSGNVAVCTQMRDDYSLSVYSAQDPKRKQTLASAYTVSYAPDGRFIFSSAMLGNLDIWAMNADGTEQRQLTTDSGDDSSAISSADGKIIFFTSNRSGAAHVWRMDRDGSNQSQLTQREGGFPIVASTDGEWVYYRSAISKQIWRVRTVGGSEEQGSLRASYRPAMPESGEQAAFFARRDGKLGIEITPSTVDQVLSRIELPAEITGGLGLNWSREGKQLYFIATTSSDNGEQSLWSVPAEGGISKKLALLGTAHVESFSVSPDGSSYAIVQGSWRHDAVLFHGLLPK